MTIWAPAAHSGLAHGMGIYITRRYTKNENKIRGIQREIVLPNGFSDFPRGGLYPIISSTYRIKSRLKKYNLLYPIIIIMMIIIIRDSSPVRQRDVICCGTIRLLRFCGSDGGFIFLAARPFPSLRCSTNSLPSSRSEKAPAWRRNGVKRARKVVRIDQLEEDARARDLLPRSRYGRRGYGLWGLIQH